MKSLFILYILAFLILMSCSDNSATQILKEEIKIDSILAMNSSFFGVDTSVLAQDVESDSIITINEIISKQNTLFFYFTFRHCDDCIKRIFRFFKNNPEYHNGNVTFISAAENVRPLFVLKEQHNIVFPFYRIDSSAQLKHNAFQYHKPFFFKVKSGRLASIHFINFNLPELTVEYLETQEKML